MRRETLDASGEDVRRETEDDGVIVGWGDRVAQTQSTDDEWRLAETETASVVADDGEVWRETTATRSCSDAAIAPLAMAQRKRLLGLSLATNAVTVTTDVRGNETVTTTTLDPATLSSRGR